YFFASFFPFRFLRLFPPHSYSFPIPVSIQFNSISFPILLAFPPFLFPQWFLLSHSCKDFPSRKCEMILDGLNGKILTEPPASTPKQNDSPAKAIRAIAVDESENWLVGCLFFAYAIAFFPHALQPFQRLFFSILLCLFPLFLIAS